MITKETSENFSQRLAALVNSALKEKGLSGRQASMSVVGHDGLIRDIRAGRLPSPDKLELLFDLLGLDFHIGPRRVDRFSGLAEAAVATDLSKPEARRRYVPFPQHRTVGGSGPAPIAMFMPWVTEQGMIPDNLSMVQPKDIRLPGAMSGACLALFDSKARRDGFGPWCGTLSGQVFAANVEIRKNLVLIYPSEVGQPAEHFTGDSLSEVVLLGRIAWISYVVS